MSWFRYTAITPGIAALILYLRAEFTSVQVLGGVLGLGHLAAIPITLIFCFWKTKWIDSVRVARYSFFVLVVTFVAWYPIDRLQREESRRQGEHIIQALKKYHDANKIYPAKLDVLAPTYLTRLPESRMGVLEYRPFRYRVNEDQSEYWLSFEVGAFIYCTFRSKYGSWATHD